MNLTTIIFKANKKLSFDLPETDLDDFVATLSDSDILRLTELAILKGAREGIDVISSLEEKYKGERFQVWIPVVPPGINEMYKVSCVKGKGHFRKSKVAKDWVDAAIMPIRSAGNTANFIVDPIRDNIIIRYWVHNTKYDVEAHVKIVQDTVAKSLGFDDRIVEDIYPKKKKTEDGERGILIEVEKERKFE